MRTRLQCAINRGFHLGGKHHWAKRTLWKEFIQVPLFIAGPGIELRILGAIVFIGVSCRGIAGYFQGESNSPNARTLNAVSYCVLGFGLAAILRTTFVSPALAEICANAPL